MSGPMRRLAPRVYWAAKRHIYRGLWVWTGRRNVRLLPLNRFGRWSGGSR